jgi:DNA-directed RNA polymerase specialized sigma24 family protein
MVRSPRALRGDEADLFQRHHDSLLRSVRRAVNAADAIIEDACSFAWMQLLRCQPERTPTLFGWLRTVAVHEAYRLLRAEGREDQIEAVGSTSPSGSNEDWEAMVGHAHELDDAIEARQALEALAALPELRRRYLSLFIAGHSYEEIARAGRRADAEPRQQAPGPRSHSAAAAG